MDDLHSLIDEGRRLSGLIDNAVHSLRTAARSAAQAELDYRKAKAQAWVTVPEGLAEERRSNVDAVAADLRFVRDVAVGEQKAALEAVRARQAQLSYVQSRMNALRAEMDLAR